MEEAEVNWQEGTAIVRLNKKLDVQVLIKAVEDQEYKVISVE